MRRRGAAAAFAAAFAVALLVAVGVAATRESRLVYSIGVGPGGPVADLTPRGAEICQGPLSPPPETFDRVVISVGTYFRSGQPLDALVRSTRDGRVIARGRLPGGYPDVGRAPEQSIAVAPTTLREPVDVCFRNTGNRRVALYGAPWLSHRTSTMRAGGKPVARDVAVRLERAEARSLLSRLPDAFEHAAVFKPAGSGRGRSGCSPWSW
jgi:hypothetical protein